MVEVVRRRLGVGLVAMLLSSAAFGSSGPFAKALLEAGWTPGAAVFVRIAGAALLLLPYAMWTMRRDLRGLVRHLPVTALYGCLAVAAAQLGYFQAVERLTVGVALLIEYCGIILVVLWVWAATRRSPHRLTVLGIVLALTGLVLVLDLTGSSTPDLVGVAWGCLAATGLAGHYVIAARPTDLSPTVFAALGLTAGALVLAALGVTGVIPMHAGSADVVLAGQVAPAWLVLAELVVVAAVAAYILGVLGARHLGSTVSSFVGLTEVLFAVLFAWLLVDQLPGPWQFAGGVVILCGIVAVRLGERRREREWRLSSTPPADFEVPSPVA